MLSDNPGIADVVQVVQVVNVHVTNLRYIREVVLCDPNALIR